MEDVNVNKRTSAKMVQQVVPGYITVQKYLRKQDKSPCKKPESRPGIKPDQMVERVAEYVLGLDNEKLAQIKIKDICQKFRLNHSFLSRKFRIERDHKLCDFIQSVKIQRAVLLLNQDQIQQTVAGNSGGFKLSINVLAQHLGYSSTEYFIRCFKKLTGVSPHKFRKYLFQDYDRLITR